MVNGLFLSMTFSSMSGKGPLDKSNGTSSESLSVPSLSGQAVQWSTDAKQTCQDGQRLLEEVYLNGETHVMGERHQHTSTSAWEQNRELNRAVCE